MKCTECRQSEMVSTREAYRFVESGLPNVVLLDTEIRTCPKCGARGAVIPDVEGLHRTLALAIISQPNPLVPHEVRFLRKWLGWSGVDFARHMGVTAETVSRWESADSGKPISATADRLLRVLVARGEPVASYPTEKLAEIEETPKSKRARYELHRGKRWEAESVAA